MPIARSVTRSAGGFAGYKAPPAQGGGNTIYADSASLADVQAAIDLASAGDTVEIPAGSATWSSNLTIPAGVKLKGAGGGWIQGASNSSVAIGTGTKTFTIRESTKLGGSAAIFGFTVSDTVTARVKYSSGATMAGTVTSWDGTDLVLNVTSTSGSGTYGRWVFTKQGETRITRSGGTITIPKHATESTGLLDLELINGATGTVISVTGDDGGAPFLIGGIQFRAGGWSRMVEVIPNGGIIYGCSAEARGFQNSASIVAGYGIRIRREEADPPGASWQTNSTMGTLDTDGEANVYIEDCYFHGFDSELHDFEANARVVVRHCVYDNCGGSTHGWDTGNFGGVRQGEIYENLFVFDNNGDNDGSLTAPMNYYFYLRGGPWTITDNEADNISSTAWGDKTEISYTIQNLRRNGGTYACWSGGYPAPHQIGQGHDSGVGGVAGENYVEGFYHWNNTGTLSIGGADYSPDECGGGPAVSTFVQASRDIFTSAKSGYTKYTHPHPLRV